MKSIFGSKIKMRISRLTSRVKVQITSTIFYSGLLYQVALVEVKSRGVTFWGTLGYKEIP